MENNLGEEIADRSVRTWESRQAHLHGLIRGRKVEIAHRPRCAGVVPSLQSPGVITTIMDMPGT